MSCNTYLKVYSAAGVKFGDLAALNAELAANGGVAELLDYHQVPPGSDFVKLGPRGKILFMNREDGSYCDEANVYGCWDDRKLFKLIAKRLSAGKLVLTLTSEGGDPDYWVIEPGKAGRSKPTF